MAKGHAGGPVDQDPVYPPEQETLTRVAEDKRHYRDEAAFLLYKDAGVGQLTRAHLKITRALDLQAAKLEEFFNTPYTENQARVLEASTAALVVIEAQLERWHHMLYPNQRGD